MAPEIPKHFDLQPTNSSSPLDSSIQSFTKDKFISFLSFFQTKIDNIYSNLMAKVPAPLQTTWSIFPSLNYVPEFWIQSPPALLKPASSLSPH